MINSHATIILRITKESTGEFNVEDLQRNSRGANAPTPPRLALTSTIIFKSYLIKISREGFYRAQICWSYVGLLHTDVTATEENTYSDWILYIYTRFPVSIFFKIDTLYNQGCYILSQPNQLTQALLVPAHDPEHQESPDKRLVEKQPSLEFRHRGESCQECHRREEYESHDTSIEHYGQLDTG